MKKTKLFVTRIFAFMMAVVLVCSVNISAFASANSGSLAVEDNMVDENGNEVESGTTNYTAYLEYIIPTLNSDGTINKGATAGVVRQNVMHTYLKAGETVYFGSSVCNSRINVDGNSRSSTETGADIVVTYPDGSVHPFDVIKDGAGYIYNRAHEENGPQITVADQSNDDKYIPLSFTATTSGLYDFSFRSQTGETGKSPTPSLIYDDDNSDPNKRPINCQGVCDIAFWDITVADMDGNEIPGRVYSKYLATSTGATWANMCGRFYVVTKDGYIYEVYLENIQPYGFVFFSNNQGLTTTELTPSSIYHSVYDNDNDCANADVEEYVTFHHPNAPDTDLAQTNMIFFEEPNKDLVGILFDEPVVPQAIPEVKFFGHQENKTYYTQGGEFVFESHGASSVSLVIDFNPSINHKHDTLQAKIDNGETLTKQEKRVYDSIKMYRDSGGSGIIEINAATVDGTNTVEWNGMDDKNIHMPIGVYDADEIGITSYPKAGEIHFPLIDVEGMYSGVRIERLNGAGGKYSDNPSLDRFGVCYNNNPLIYGTIEGPLDPSITPTLSPDGKYYELSDGTRSFRFTSTSAGPMYFAPGYKPTYNYAKMHQPGYDLLYNVCKYGNINEHYSTLTRNDNYIPPEDEGYGEGVAVNGSAEYSHVPINSRDHNMSYGTDGNISGGGNQALIDFGTYYYGEVTTKVQFDAQIEIIDNEGVGEISGRVFYDYYNNGKYNKKYATVDGDYLLSDIKVWLTDINGNKLQVLSPDGYLVYKDSTGKDVFKTELGNFVDADGNTVACTEADLDPQYYTTTTDLNGAYSFKGVYYGKGNSKDFYVKTDLTDTQKTAYTICTTANDFNLSTGKQKVTLNDDNPDRQLGDIGYTTPDKNLVDLSVVKYWDGEVEDRPSNIKVKLFQVDPKTNDAKVYSEKLLSATNGWSYTFTDLNKAYKYYVEEWIDIHDHDELIGTSDPRFVQADEDNFNNEITSSITETNNDSGYFANFTFNPNIVGPTIVITNKEIIHNYRVVFHNNFDGYSGINSEDYFRIYCRENAIPTVKEHTKFNDVYALNKNTWDIDAFYDIPERDGYVFLGWYYEPGFNEGSKVMKWNVDDYSGDNATDHDGDKYTMTDNNVYHIYAHWEPVGTVTKQDEKILPNNRTYYGGFELFGVQIRNYRLDPNYEDEDGNPKDEWYAKEDYYGYKKEIQGLRFVTAIRNGLLVKVNSAFDNDAGYELYDYNGTKTYSKDTSYLNLDYGYAVASKINWDKHYAGFTKNQAYYDKNGLVCLDTNNNGVDTSKYYRFVVNTPCTSAVGPNYVDDDNIDKENSFQPSTNILDHRNFAEYRIMSAVSTYNELTDTVNMDNEVVARPYLHYVDSNGLPRYYYSDYTGSSALAKGCSVSYNSAYSIIGDLLESVTHMNDKA